MPGGAVFLLSAALLAIALGCERARPAPPSGASPRAVPSPSSTAAGARFLKGQLHAHSNRSGDSDTPPEEAAAWYAAHGYDFLVFTDHNRITEIPAPAGMLVIPGVELTQNLPTCDPPPEPGFACLLHINALFVAARGEGGAARQSEQSPGAPASWGPLLGLSRVELYGRAVDRARALGGLAQLNHPNFHRGADLGVILALARRGLALIEIANQAADSDNDGDARHPSAEALWDAALAQGARVYGTATDDAHHYGDADKVRARGEIAYVGDLGFVMVRADRSAAGLRAAIEAGDFYSSTGVLLDRLEISREAISLEVHPAELPAGAAGGEPLIEVIADGAVISSAHTASLRFDPRGRARRYLRVRITDARGRRAWSQPLWPAP
jgi:hypothetical protein